MSRKRKRPEQGPASIEGTRKRQRKRRTHVREEHDREDTTTVQDHPSLSPYYPRVLSLRAYLLSKLPPSSKLRRRRLACLDGRDAYLDKGDGRTNGFLSARQLSELLDCTLVGVSEKSSTPGPGVRVDRTLLAQSQSASTCASGSDTGICSQVEVRFHEFHIHPWTNTLSCIACCVVLYLAHASIALILPIHPIFRVHMTDTESR